MPPPDNGNEYIDFTQLMNLEKLDKDTYRSTALAFAGANGTRAYGGHVYSQACYAAAQTVRKDQVLHNMSGWFLIAGKTNEHFIYKVRRIKDGGFAMRGVDVYQASDPNICFTCVCSFKRPEKPSLPQVDVRQHANLYERFSSVLKDKKPNDHIEMPGIDAPWYWDYSRKHGGYNDPFPGLELRKVDMTGYNDARPPLERRNLKYYSVRGSLPSIDEDPNIHVCAHLYASDRNSLFVISNHVDIGNDYSAIASLSHTVIIHATAQELDMIEHSPKGDKPRWFCQEAWTGGARQGRGLEETRMWRADDGFHVATSMQDGLVRLKEGAGGKGKDGFSADGMTAQMDAFRMSKGSGSKL